MNETNLTYLFKPASKLSWGYGDGGEKGGRKLPPLHVSLPQLSPSFVAPPPERLGKLVRRLYMFVYTLPGNSSLHSKSSSLGVTSNNSIILSRDS